MFELPGYTDLKQIGVGGMAVVYRATQISFKRQVAVKVLMSEYASDDGFAERFLREAETVASLSHPHIIPVYDFGQRNGTSYMVMEYLTGGDLRQWIHRGLEEDEILQIVSDMASALNFAHDKGYVHRDIKPDNIMFREDNSAVLTDFGIVRLKNANNQVTVAGKILGTPKYMSPEQLQGHPVDGRSDIYSLGIMFYEMFTKEAPFQDKEFMALAMKHLQAPIPQLPARFSKYQSLFEKMVAKNPADRFKTGMEIVKQIRQIRTGRYDMLEIDVDAMRAGTIDAGLSPSTSTIDEALGKGMTGIGDATEISLKSIGSGKLVLNSDPFDLSTMDTASIPNFSLAAAGSKVNAAMQKLENRRLAPPVEEVNEGMVSEESDAKGLVFKSYDYSSQMVAVDWMRLSRMLSAFNTKLLDWYHQRGGQCGKVYLSVTTSPENFDKIVQAIQQWATIDACKFLKKTGIRLKLIDYKTQQETDMRVKL